MVCPACPIAAAAIATAATTGVASGSVVVAAHSYAWDAATTAVAVIAVIAPFAIAARLYNWDLVRIASPVFLGAAAVTAGYLGYNYYYDEGSSPSCSGEVDSYE